MSKSKSPAASSSSLADFFHALPVLETGRLLLRPLAAGDAEGMFAITSDPAVSKYLSWEPHESVSEAKAFLKRFTDAYAAGHPAPWAVVDRSSKQFIGTCGIIDAHQRHKWAQISFGLARANWNKGLMTEAVSAAVDSIFGSTEVHRIEALPQAANAPARRVLEKARLTHEGTLRQNMFAKGAYHDLAMYSILRSEWTGG